MKVLEGIVIGTKMQKTVVIAVERQTVHPLYRKRLRKHKKYKVDAGDFSVVLGNKVKIVQTKPKSREKYFKIVEVLEGKQ